LGLPCAERCADFELDNVRRALRGTFALTAFDLRRLVTARRQRLSVTRTCCTTK
jgi:hypothetical protein